MKRFVCLLPLLLMPVTLLAHPGHGLATGHEWFHALFPFLGALLVILAKPVGGRVLMEVRRFIGR